MPPSSVIAIGTPGILMTWRFTSSIVVLRSDSFVSASPTNGMAMVATDRPDSASRRVNRQAVGEQMTPSLIAPLEAQRGVTRGVT